MPKFRDRILMCPPDYFTVDYVINPWMAGQESSLDIAMAKKQWNELKGAISEVADVITMRSATLYASKGLSTFSEEQARVHAAQGVHFTKREIPLRTLASVCEEQGVDRIDFLSIDVEGFERRVLEGADFERFRPLAIVIEATRPNTREPSHGDWEDLLLAGRYRYAAFDGLNRYYVREEDAALAPRLEVGPNVFDNYAPHRWLREIERAHSRKAKYKRARFPFGNALARVGSALRGERD
jgi:FkbM family methyltransferase